MNYDGVEKRKHKRINASFVVSYRPVEQEDSADLSQTKNFSKGGILLTTNIKFPSGSLLRMFIQVPNIREKIDVLGKVVESREVVKDLIYETRIAFQNLDDKVFSILGDTVQEFKEPDEEKND